MLSESLHEKMLSSCEFGKSPTVSAHFIWSACLESVKQKKAGRSDEKGVKDEDRCRFFNLFFLDGFDLTGAARQPARHKYTPAVGREADMTGVALRDLTIWRAVAQQSFFSSRLHLPFFE